ncbi:hypothetical protein DEF23_25170 [Marinitenerispora sediminis]|uniref:Histone acetyltransferase Rv0428c-like SH3 domain-containing protein n=1 Tax=Marinitenerispora sediminis TaxID=1931232 RepID=A0A368T5Y2_9ACTN|nr:hypothetical protein [Marinitenerispora sediminis]RCV48326.1 hypothetical protein DEF23_25170 [Marinitenerispora sediminis]RCV52244.1 hypothetical protein DEF28_13390 [Marinitenerispora sediminis]RCV59050.1 hypothetical protein DEF24_11325 [Marinitenerispora sediminis]
MGYVARLANTVTPQDVGRRVTLRNRLPDGRFRDIVGVLESWEDGVIRVRRRDGETAAVEARDVVASRIVPQHPPRRRGRPDTGRGDPAP